MKKLTGAMVCCFAIFSSEQGNTAPIVKTLDGVCPQGQCPCVGCNQCASSPGECAPPCLQNCTTAVPTASLYDISGQGAIFYCLDNTSIQPVTNVPNKYKDRTWYTCGTRSIPFPKTSDAPEPLSTSYAAYSFDSGAVFSCPKGEVYTPTSGTWFTCSNPELLKDATAEKPQN